jgi:DNA polymerase delta subunit 1
MSGKRFNDQGGDAAKRLRPPGDDDGDFDEDEMLQMELDHDDAGPPEPMVDDGDASAPFMTLGEHFMSRSQKWARPRVVGLNPSQHAISIQNLEADYRTDKPVRDLGPGSAEAKVAVLRVYGVTAEGHSVLMHVHRFLPYFFVPAWSSFEPSQVGAFFNTLNNKVRSQMGGRDAVTNPVLKVEVVHKQSLMYFQQSSSGVFLKITIALRMRQPSARSHYAPCGAARHARCRARSLRAPSVFARAGRRRGGVRPLVRAQLPDV